MMIELKKVREAYDTVPQGYQLLGAGLDFKLLEGNGGFLGICFDASSDCASWCSEEQVWLGRNCDLLYAAKIGSEICIKNGYMSTEDDYIESTLPDSGARSEFVSGAVRDASLGKGIPSLIPTEALRAVSKRFEDGAVKYGRNNWQLGIPLSRYVDSIYRHLWAFMRGDASEDHGAAVIWNAMCMVETQKMIDKGLLPAELNDLK